MYSLLFFVLFASVCFFIGRKVYDSFKLNVDNRVRRYFLIFFSVLLAVFCSLFYLKYDNEGYDYGLDCLFCNKNMPYNIKPVTDNHHILCLLDSDGFEITGVGFKHRESSFKINKILAYVYDDTFVLLKVKDSLNDIRYLELYETGYKGNEGNVIVSFREINNNKSDYQWIEIDRKKIDTIKSLKITFTLGILLSLFLLFWEATDRNRPNIHYMK